MLTHPARMCSTQIRMDGWTAWGKDFVVLLSA